MTREKMVLFGAGKIGRSFIGQVFSRSGYEVIFVDINRQLIDRLNESRQYKIIIKGPEADEIIWISNVRGIHLHDSEQVIAALADASIAGISVGQQGLPAALPLIAQSLLLRKQKHGEWPLDLIIAENMRNADQYFAAELANLLPPGYPVSQFVGLVETSIGKMVPIMTEKDVKEDPLQVFAEPYNTLIVARNGFKNPVPDSSFLAPKQNIKAWVDRKLFIHNLGHATAAYLGYSNYPEDRYMHQLLDHPDILEETRRTMQQSADILLGLYPDEFTRQQLEEHIDDLLGRFRNKALGDTTFRVGCDLFRKLGPEDRLVAPIRAAQKLNKSYNLILNALVAGISFRAKDENGNYYPADQKFFAESENGVNYILKTVCKLDIRMDCCLPLADGKVKPG